MRVPADPPPLPDLIRSQGPDQLFRIASSNVGRVPENKYLHWSQLKYRMPPKGFTLEQWWLAAKLARLSARHELPLVDAAGRPFAFTDSGHLHRLLHEVDRALGSSVVLPEDVADRHSRDFYLKSSLYEEAITSSQLEGASTTRLVAKAMLRTGRPARDRSERMILNNHHAMEFVREQAATALSMEVLLELHRIVAAGTLDDETACGRLRRPDEDVAVVDERDGAVMYTPPDAALLPERLAHVLAFANAPQEARFLHPVVKAALLHFMVGYEHPFVDGNGRTARALFYWAMVRAGYPLAEFLSISTIIRKAPAQYVRAYLLSERDDNDATYFLDYHLRVLLRATDALRGYLGRKARELRDVERLLAQKVRDAGLNHRQVAAIRHLGKHPGRTYTIAEHRRAHHVTYQTARTDLLKLAGLGLLRLTRTVRQGRAFHFALAPDVAVPGSPTVAGAARTPSRAGRGDGL